MIATAPGKLILTGEYAVLDGAPSIVIAVDRRAVARQTATPHGSSSFLLAVADEIAARRGAEDPATRAALEITVDSQAFYDKLTKLGLGSSAAVTVAATALALGTVDREQVLAVALAAHARAQGPRGARGSGADIAASVYGGTIVYTRAEAVDALGSTRQADAQPPCRIERRRWPASVTLLPFFTGAAADTVSLVARVQAARDSNRAAVEAALAAIADASRAACAALVAPADIASVALIGALALAANAMDRLALATAIDLVPACVSAARAAMASLGGTAKTTGAGGGDVGIAVIPHTIDATLAGRLLIEAGCQPLRISLDDTGVDLHADAS
jgi:phosphomevalonate kinase